MKKKSARVGIRALLSITVILLVAGVVALVQMDSHKGASAQVIPTPFWSSYYGTHTTFNGELIAVGQVVRAYDPTDVLCGETTVTVAGQYGLMSVYGDDPMSHVDEGAVYGDRLTFRIDGNLAETVGDITWYGGFGLYEVDLAASGEPAVTPSPTPATPVDITNYKGIELEYGLWKDPYTRIFSGKPGERVAEISNYPRVYEDTEWHNYGEDTPFTVQEADLNDWLADGTRVYSDVHGDTYELGEKATHWTSDPLPGIFPKWLEYGAPQIVTDTSRVAFPSVKLRRPITLKAISIATTLQLTDEPTSKYDTQLKADYFVASNLSSTTRQLMYVHYERK